MSDAPPLAGTSPFDNPGQMRGANAGLLKAMDDRLGEDSRVENERAALLALAPQIRAFLEQGAATGAVLEDVEERTACQVLLDYWSSALSHAGITTPRARLAPFDRARLPELPDTDCPFPGLEPMHDPTLFFGRTRAVEELLVRVSASRLVVVLGASGSGKSSLIAAGVLPQLAPRYRVVGPFTPGAAATPDSRFDGAAEAAKLRVDASRLADLLGAAGAPPTLVVVDQFEEAFTLCSEKGCNSMVAALAALLQSRDGDRVLLSLREDLGGRLNTLEPFRQFLDLEQHARFSMQEWRMGYSDLRAAVERPAARVNLNFAPDVVDDLVKSVVGLDTALPLLQFALQALWEGREHNRVTRAVYERICGSPDGKRCSPLVALERFAEQVFDGLGEQQDEGRRILLELVRVDNMLESHRQPVLRSALCAIPPANAGTPEVLHRLEAAEFVRMRPTGRGGDALVEVKNEALLRLWPRHAGWISEKREQVRERIALSDLAKRWRDLGRSRSAGLLSPWQLDDAKKLPDLDPLEREYVDASEAAARRHERLRLALAVFVSVIVVAGALGGWFTLKERALREASRLETAIAQASAASHQGQMADALPRALEAAAEWRALTGDLRPDASSAVSWSSLLSRLEAWFLPKDRSRSIRGQLRTMLLANLSRAQGLTQIFVSKSAVFRAVAFRPTRADETTSSPLLAFAGSDGQIFLAELDALGRSQRSWSIPGACQADTGSSTVAVTTLAFDQTGRLLAAGCADGRVNLWLVDGWRKVGEQHPFARRVLALAFSRDGMLAASGFVLGTAPLKDKFALFKTDPACALDSAGRPCDALAEGPKTAWPEEPNGVWSLAFSPAPGEEMLLAGDGDGRLFVCKSATWLCTSSPAYPKGDIARDDAILALAYSSDGAHFAAVGHWRGGVDLWDAALSKRRRLDLADWYSPVYSLAFFRVCDRLQIAIGKGTGLQVWPAEFPNGEQNSESDKSCARPRPTPIGDWTNSIAFDSRSSLLTAASGLGYVAILDPATISDGASGTAIESSRGAVIAEQGSATWLAMPVSLKGEGNLAVLKVRDGQIERGEQVPIQAGDGLIRRVSAGRQARRLATLRCPAQDCPNGKGLVVEVWQFDMRDDRLVLGERLASLSAADFIHRDSTDLAPLRIALSPDGEWLVVSFDESGALLAAQVRTDGAKPLWIDDPDMVREIAFSGNGAFFAARGCIPGQDRKCPPAPASIASGYGRSHPTDFRNLEAFPNP